MTSVLANAILAFLESDKGGTLADLRRFLVEKDYRRGYLATVKDPDIVYFWEKEYPLLSGQPQAPLLTRLDSFLRPRIIRNIVSQKDSALNLPAIMNEGKIFLAKLAHGAIGESNAYLLGTLLVSRFYQTALARQDQEEASRRPFYLYIDEFHNFVTPSLSTILSGARKYQLGVTLAHQDMTQLSSRDPELASSLLTNPCTRISFRTGDPDTRKLAPSFSSFETVDFQTLGRGEALCRVERSDFDFNLETLPLPQKNSEESSLSELLAGIRTLSRKKFARPRTEVESAYAATHSFHITPPRTPEQREANVYTPESGEVLRRERQPGRSEYDPVEASKPGRGGKQHKYLQELLKGIGERLGMRAAIEKALLDGTGSVDVVLESESVSIACEISIGTDAEYELQNVQKCLAAGFDWIILTCPNAKKLGSLKSFVTPHLDEAVIGKVHFLEPQDTISFITEAAIPEREQTIGGYKVALKYTGAGSNEIEIKRQAVSHVVLKALKRMKQ